MTMDIQFVDFYIIVLFVLANFLNAEFIKYGKEYNFEEKLLIHDGSSSNVGYQVKALLRLELLNKDLYKISLANPKLLVYSKRNGNRFVPHESNIDYYNNDPFLIEVSEGKVTKVFISKDDDKGMVIVKKAVSNLFQFQTSNYRGKENDLSGTCNVNYQVENLNRIVGTKDNCIFSNTGTTKTVWGGVLQSKRKTDIILDNGKLESIISWEEHILAPYLGQVIQANVSAQLEMRLTGFETLEENFPSESIENIIANLESETGKKFEVFHLIPEEIKITGTDCPKFAKVISENAEYLKDKYLGTSKSASVFIDAVKAAKRSSVQELYNVINAKKNKKILPQLLDILGTAQTVNTHQAAMKLLKMDTEQYDLNLCERYFWALSMTPVVQEHILKELKQLVEIKYRNNKLWQTMILTLAAVVNKFVNQEAHSEQLVTETIDFFGTKVKECPNDDDDCQQIYIKALNNIPHVKAISLLSFIIENSPKKSGARAIKAISKIDSKYWDKDVIKMAEKVLLSSKRYDSSTRIFAVDILLRSKPSYDQLCRIVSILKQNDKSRELKEYLLQRLDELSDSCSSFKSLLKRVLIENGYNNYDALSQGGLSTAFSRAFMSRGFLSTSQEIVGGVLKQGTVNVNVMHEGKTQTYFSLGIFAGGLSSFVSAEEDSTIDDEVSTAGLELTVLGSELRPFVFFNGTGELMSHVWSGTASSLTPAYQALLLLDESAYSVPLASGKMLNVQLESTASVDLSGKIEISLWSRNAQSLVWNRAGIWIKNSLSINAPYIEGDVSVDLSVEPQLKLAADLDFSSGASLCLRLQQPNTFVKWNSYKTLRIPGTNHVSKRSRHVNVPVPGKTYSLNSKNDDMCKKVFS